MLNRESWALNAGVDYFPEIEKGLCRCGCGQKTTIAKQNHTRNGWTRGQPVRFIKGHASRGRTDLIGPNNGRWKGGKFLHSAGYILIWKPDHPRSYLNGYVLEHILIAEKVLGKPLPDDAVVHHVNEVRTDNRKENLVICENNAYHQSLHRRMRALKACGHANWRKCAYCKEYDDPKNLSINGLSHVYHKKCVNEYHKQLRKRKNVTAGITGFAR